MDKLTGALYGQFMCGGDTAELQIRGGELWRRPIGSTAWRQEGTGPIIHGNTHDLELRIRKVGWLPMEMSFMVDNQVPACIWITQLPDRLMEG